ncbi:MAG: hypothetical protein WB239_07545 [Acidimicrobiia bacterium]
MITAIALSGAGALFHNLREGFSLLAGETAPALVATVALIVAWWRTSGAALWWLTSAWVGLNLMVGAILSVIPLPILPFVPDQSTGHYLSHVIYGLTQLPAVWALWITRPRRVYA